MADINFTQFDLKTNLSLNDFIVGYDENGLIEIRTKISNLSNFILNDEKIEFDELNKRLSISNGKSVSLSALNLLSVKEFSYPSETNYSLQISDVNNLVTFNNDYSTIIVLENDSVEKFPIGSEIKIMRKGTGDVSLSAQNGINIRSENSSLFLRDVNSVVNLLKIENNDWVLYGDLQ